MKKKGFTLIELLAVIIVLSVIALIATPIIINVLEESKEKSRMQSVVGYADAVRLSYVEEQLNNTGKPLGELASLKIQGNKVNCNISKYDEKYGTVLHGCEVIEKETGTGNYCYMSGNVYNDDSKECENILGIAVSGKIEYKTPNIEVISQIPEHTEYAVSKQIKIEYPSLMVVEEQNYIKVSKSVELNNVIGKCGVETDPIHCEGNSETVIEPNTWYQVNGTTKFKIDSNIKVEAVTGKENIFGNIETYEEEKIDITKPDITNSSMTTTSDKIVVKANCSDAESGISKYYFGINEEEYQDNGTTDAYAFTGLRKETEYNIKVKCVNGSLLESEITDKVTTTTIENPVIEQVSATIASGYTWATERVIRITFNGTGIENPSYYYSLDGSEWTKVTETTKDLIFTSNGYLYAKTVDEAGNTANASTYTVAETSAGKPTTPAITGGSDEWINTSRVISVLTESTETSGIKTYQYYISTSSSTQTDGSWTDGSSITVTTNGTRYVYFRAIANNGKVSSISSYQVTKVDTEKPTCAFTGENTTWTTSNKTITANCNDTTSGCTTATSSKSWTYNSGTTSTTTLSYTITDNAGNSETCSKAASIYVDKEAPTTPTAGAIGAVSGSNATGSVKTAASGSTDAGSGGITYKYLIKTNSTTPANTDTGFTTTKTFTRSCGTSYYAWAIAEDAVGNRSTVKYLGTTSDGANSYSGWGTCSKTCGTGSQTRTNTCALVTTGLSQNCNTQSCGPIYWVSNYVGQNGATINVQHGYAPYGANFTTSTFKDYGGERADNNGTQFSIASSIVATQGLKYLTINVEWYPGTNQGYFKIINASTGAALYSSTSQLYQVNLKIDVSSASSVYIASTGWSWPQSGGPSFLISTAYFHD